MKDYQDKKIRKHIVRYIRKASGDVSEWKYTKIDEAHEKVLKKIEIAPGEFPIVSFYLSENSFYLLTTRRVAGFYDKREVEFFPTYIKQDNFGNFKGLNSELYRYKHIEVVTFDVEGENYCQRLQFETGKASMAPIYYFRWWEIKYPIFDKLIN